MPCPHQADLVRDISPDAFITACDPLINAKTRAKARERPSPSEHDPKRSERRSRRTRTVRVRRTQLIRLTRPGHCCADSGGLERDHRRVDRSLSIQIGMCRRSTWTSTPHLTCRLESCTTADGWRRAEPLFCSEQPAALCRAPCCASSIRTALLRRRSGLSRAIPHTWSVSCGLDDPACLTFLSPTIRHFR